MKQEIFQGDLEEAFLQGKPTERRLFVRQPPEGIPGLDPRQILQMQKEVYGTVRGTASWRETIVDYLRDDLLYNQSMLDPCIFLLKSTEAIWNEKTSKIPNYPFQESEWLAKHNENTQEKEFLPTEGRLVLLVDDVLESGGAEHRERMQKLRQRFRFGKYKSLMDEGGGVFNGRRLRQGKHFGVKADMADYITHKVKEIKIPMNRKKELDQDITEAERAGFRACTMTLMWVAREGRFDILGGVSVLAKKVNQAKVCDLLDCNKVVTHLRSTKDLGILFLPVDPREAVFYSFADAAMPEQGELHPQAGLIIAVAPKKINGGSEEPLNMLAARSGKLDRVCSSSLATEAYAMVGAVSCAEWVQYCYLEMANANFLNCQLKQRVKDWNDSEPEHKNENGIEGKLLIAETGNDFFKETLTATDAKSLYDALHKEAKGKEPRVALAVAEIKQSLAALKAGPKWIPHNYMLADGLTKKLDKSNLAPLLKLMSSGHYSMQSEMKEQEFREKLKEQGGSVARQRGRQQKQQLNEVAATLRQEGFHNTS